MEDSNVVQLWNALDKKERSSLRAFLNSPFFNHRQDVILLYEWLVKTTAGRLKAFSRDAAFRYVFGNIPYDNLRFNHTCSFLSQEIEHFLAWEEFTTPGDWRELFLCRALRKRGIRDAFEKKTTQLSTRHEAQPRRNGAYYLFRYQLEYEKYAYKIQYDREAPLQTETATNALLHFFILENLRWAGTALSIQARYGAQNMMPLTESVLEQVQQSDTQAHPELKMMYLGYAVLSDKENEDNFRQLKALIQGKGHLFNRDEIHDLYLLAINFCLRRHNRGERPGYTRESYLLYREALEKGLLTDNARIQKFAYNNITRLACLCGETDWALSFLENYKTALPAEDRENTYRYNLAIYHYLNGDYEKVPNLLQTFDFSDQDTQLNARQMLVRTYFELQEWQSLNSLLDSFHMYVKRLKDIGYLRELYLNFIKYVRKIVQMQYKNKEKQKMLADQIRSETYVAEKEWLLSKL